MKRLFYGWYMVGASSAMQFVQGTLLLQSFGAYFAVLRDDQGWSKTELSAAAAMHQVEAAILGPLIGWFIDRFGAQWVIRAGVVIFGVGFILLSTIESLLAFYGAFIVWQQPAEWVGRSAVYVDEPYIERKPDIARICRNVRALEDVTIGPGRTVTLRSCENLRFP